MQTPWDCNLILSHTPFFLHNVANFVNEAAFRLVEELREWLKVNEFPQEYAEALERHGYFNLNFIAGLKVEVR